MKKSDRTRQFIIEKTAPVFNKQGYTGTSLAALEQATGLTKGSLYGNFHDKEEMALEVFQYSVEVMRTEFGKEISVKKNSKDKLIAMMNTFAAYVFHPPIDGGCPILNNAVESDDFNPAMRKAVVSAIDRMVGNIARLIDEGKKNGEFRKDVKSRELAYVFFTSIEGAIMVSRVSANDSAMKAIVKHNKEILDQISL
jgi:TetR/AcrR family transcriptional regulator, transcriptional repressor for nem operon